MIRTSVTYAIRVLSAVLLSAVPTAAQLPNLADITGINIDPSKGSVTVGRPQNPFETIDRTIQGTVGAPAKQFILSARANAGPLQGVPPSIARSLVALGVRQDLISRARWSTNWRAVDTHFTRDQDAVCLQDVIIFRNLGDALNDVALWVHELKHFEQYERLGLDRFAYEYTINAGVYEREADEAETRAEERIAAGALNGTLATSVPIQSPWVVPPPATYYSYCSTFAGNSPTIPGGLPQGSRCFIVTAGRQAWGTVVGFYR